MPPSTTASGAIALSLAELAAFDPRPGRHGAEHRYCCPLPSCAGKPINRAHQSVSVNIETGLWNCHRCGASGRLKEHWTDRPKESHREHRRRQRERALSLPPAPKPETSTRTSSTTWRQEIAGVVPVADTPAASYLEQRAIPLMLASASGARYQARFYGRPAVVFPIRDATGKLVAAQGRYLDGRDPKAQTAGPAKMGVFMTPGALDGDTIILTEAPIDALSLAMAGLPALALCGTALRTWLLPLCDWKTLGLGFDADQAGDKAETEWSGALGPHGATVKRLRPEGAKDWNELLQRQGVAAVRTVLISARLLDPLAPYAALITAAHRQELGPAVVRINGVDLDVNAAVRMLADRMRAKQAGLSSDPYADEELAVYMGRMDMIQEWQRRR